MMTHAECFPPYLFYPKDSIRAGGMAQVAQCLPSKCEVLSSNPSTEKKKTIGKGFNK
jgi:hypothetical protein